MVVLWLILGVSQAFLFFLVGSNEEERIPKPKTRKDQPLALVVPGFLGDCGDFEELAEEMRQAGYKVRRFWIHYDLGWGFRVWGS